MQVCVRASFFSIPVFQHLLGCHAMQQFWTMIIMVAQLAYLALTHFPLLHYTLQLLHHFAPGFCTVLCVFVNKHH